MPKRESKREAHSAEPPGAPSDSERWGARASGLLRTVAALGWFSLVTRLLATALRGSESGIGPWIRRTDTLASICSQLAVLLGSTELVLLVVGTLAERGFSYAYRVAIVPASAAVLMLVMLSSTMGLEPQMSVVIAASCLFLTGFAAAVAVRKIDTRAQGLVLSACGLAGLSQFFARLFVTHSALFDPVWVARLSGLSTLGFVFDGLAIALAATRLVSERRKPAAFALFAAMGLGSIVAWHALRGGLDGATAFDIVASRSLGELTPGSDVIGAAGSRYALESFAVLLSGIVVLWPAPVSRGIVSVGLAILARPTVDVPACALVLSLAALAAPIAERNDSANTRQSEPSGGGPRREASADG